MHPTIIAQPALAPLPVAEVEHAEALHFEDAYDAALELAERELRTGLKRPTLDGEDDGSLLPARAYSFLAEHPDETAAVRVSVSPADGGAFVATLVERLTHRVGDLDGAGEAFYPSLEAATAAAQEQSDNRRNLSVVWALGDTLRPAVLCFDGTIYKPA